MNSNMAEKKIPVVSRERARHLIQTSRNRTLVTGGGSQRANNTRVSRRARFCRHSLSR